MGRDEVSRGEEEEDAAAAYTMGAAPRISLSLSLSSSLLLNTYRHAQPTKKRGKRSDQHHPPRAPPPTPLPSPPAAVRARRISSPAPSPPVPSQACQFLRRTIYI